MRRILSACVVPVLAGTLGFAGISGCTGDGDGGEGGSARPTVTSTETVTGEPTPTRSRGQEPSQEGPSVDGAAATVQAYFDAVNSRDYQRAWELGGRNLGGSYASFKAGFDDTVRSTPHIGDVNGDTVTVTIDALQTDGAVRHFSGTYTVQQGTIAHADVRAKGGDPPTSDSAEPAEPSESGSSSPQEPTTGTTDLDCSDLTGPTHVGSSDPYRLDADDDGMGCD